MEVALGLEDGGDHLAAHEEGRHVAEAARAEEFRGFRVQRVQSLEG